MKITRSTCEFGDIAYSLLSLEELKRFPTSYIPKNISPEEDDFFPGSVTLSAKSFSLINDNLSIDVCKILDGNRRIFAYSNESLLIPVIIFFNLNHYDEAYLYSKINRNSRFSTYQSIVERFEVDHNSDAYAANTLVRCLTTHKDSALYKKINMSAIDGPTSIDMMSYIEPLISKNGALYELFTKKWYQIKPKKRDPSIQLRILENAINGAHDCGLDISDNDVLKNIFESLSSVIPYLAKNYKDLSKKKFEEYWRDAYEKKVN